MELMRIVSAAVQPFVSIANAEYCPAWEMETAFVVSPVDQIGN